MILYCISFKNVSRKDRYSYSRSNLFSKTILKNCFPKKIKIKITNDPKLHFYEERSTERQILLLEV